MTELEKLRAENAALQEQVATLREVVSRAKEYFSEFDCEGDCDPNVGFHQPECHWRDEFYKALRKSTEPRMLTELRAAREALAVYTTIMPYQTAFIMAREKWAKDAITRLDAFLGEFGG